MPYTRREKIIELKQLLLKGYTQEEIADIMGYSDRRSVASFMRRFGLCSLDNETRKKVKENVKNSKC